MLWEYEAPLMVNADHCEGGQEKLMSYVVGKYHKSSRSLKALLPKLRSMD